MALAEQYRNEWFIQAPWGRICIIAWGSCENPPILVVHGERDSLASFQPLMKNLPNTFYYVGMELPGQGRSDPFPPGLPVTLWDLVYAIEVVRSHFRWERFLYMAHSFAATLGRLYNITHPSRIVGAIELDHITPAMVCPVDKFAAWYDHWFTNYYEKYYLYNSPKEKGPKYTWDEAIERVLKTRDLTPELAQATIERFSEPVGEGYIRFTYDRRSNNFLRPPFAPEQLKHLYTTLSTPTLGIVTDDSIKKGLFQNTPYLLEDGPTYAVRKVSGSHDVHVKHPDRVALFICQFLKYGLNGLDRKAKL